jgi:hypothetical protein
MRQLAALALLAASCAHTAVKHELQLRGATELDEATANSLLRKFRVHVAVTPTSAIESIVLNWYWDRGYINATADLVRGDDGRATITIDEGSQFRIGAVELVGTDDEKRQVDMRLLPKSGAIYNRSAIADSLMRVKLQLPGTTVRTETRVEPPKREVRLQFMLAR